MTPTAHRTSQHAAAAPIESRSRHFPPQPWREKPSRLAGLAGVVRSTRPIGSEGWAPPELHLAISQLNRSENATDPNHLLYGIGHAWRDQVRAAELSRYEVLERHALVTYDSDDYIIATSKELGQAALDLATIPICSGAEFRRTGFPLRRPASDEPIRWTSAVDLHSGQPCYLPTVMTYLTHETLPSEWFWLPISTGAAVHTTPAQALAAAIMETAERDAVAIGWLQNLALPPLPDRDLPPEISAPLRWYDARRIRTRFLDATTDLAIPTVICLQTTEDSTRAAQVIGTASASSLDRAAGKALLECAAGRGAIHKAPASPQRYRDYGRIGDQAVSMARPHKRAAFGAWLTATAPRPRSDAPGLASDGADLLAQLLARLERRAVRAYGVDITTRELAAEGLVAMRVVLPDLVPLSLHPLAHYRSTPRLYTAPVAMGLPARPESGLNRHPVPMA